MSLSLLKIKETSEISSEYGEAFDNLSEEEKSLNV